MATRNNRCTNPALANNNTGWGGASTPVRTAVTGFDRGFAARYTTGSFIRSQSGAASPGVTYIVSLYLRLATFAGSGSFYIEWQDIGGDPLDYTTGSWSATANVVTRASVSGTAPGGTVFAAVVLDGENFASNAADFTMALIEQGAVLQAYFDGDSPGATWDGTAGNSASTLIDAAFAPPLRPRRARLGALLQV